MTKTNVLEFSLPDPKGWMRERVEKTRQDPLRAVLSFIANLPLTLYLLVQVWPFVTDWPYLFLFLLTAIPFVFLARLRRDAAKSVTLTFLTVTVLYFIVVKPVVFSVAGEALSLNNRFFKFENYQYVHDFDKAIKKMFPVGTSKDEVDRVLVGRGGSESRQWDNKEKYGVTYKYVSFNGSYICLRWEVHATYDAEKKKIKETKVYYEGMCIPD